jgi:hypothetical protein
MKDYYEVSGSDVSKIGWVEITSEEGQSGYLWYLKAEADTRARFTDYIRNGYVRGCEGNVAAPNSNADAATFTGAGAQAGAGINNPCGY